MVIKCKIVLFIGLVVAFLSCGKRKVKHDQEEQLDAKGKELVVKYKAIEDWDKSNGFTSYFQRKFIEQNNLMLFKGRVYDIVKRDSDYIVKIMDERRDADHNFIAFVTFNPQELNEKLTDDKSTDGVFVIRVLKIISSNPSIKEDEERDGDDQSFTYSHLSDDADRMLTIFKGEVIDCQFEMLAKDK